MNTLIAMVFDGPYDAEKARLEMRMMEKNELVDRADSIICAFKRLKNEFFQPWREMS